MHHAESIGDQAEAIERKNLSSACHYASDGSASLDWLVLLCVAVIE